MTSRPRRPEAGSPSAPLVPSARRLACAALGLALAACGGSSPAADAVNGCAAADYVAGSAITFAYPAFNPRCLTVSAGQTVTFSGDFSGHPLTPGVAPSSSGQNPAGNPITATKTGSSASFTFPSPGTYPYYCQYHSGNGMYGAIRVQ